mgnify:CR=1 FL=1
MNSEKPTPVTIVGAGPVGLMLANLLAAYDVPVVVIERHDTTVQEPRAISIDDESLRSLQIPQLDAALKATCAMDYGSVYLGPDRQPLLQYRQPPPNTDTQNAVLLPSPYLRPCWLQTWPNIRTPGFVLARKSPH